MMKWQTCCQTPHGSETLTHRMMQSTGREWKIKEGRKMEWMAWEQDGTEG